MEKIKISVIIPIYNTSKYLAECLDSIMNQTFRSIEIIMIDDGSTDSSYEIALEYKQKDRRFILIRTDNRGQSAARNTGLDNAKGEYICFLDSDDYLSHEALEILYNRAKNDDLDILKFSAFVFEDEKREYIWRYWQEGFGYKYHGTYNDTYSGTKLFGNFIKNDDYYPSVCMELIRKSFLASNNIRFLEGVILEDNLFNYESMMVANRIGVLNKPLYYRRVRPSSTMTNPQLMRKIKSISVIIQRLEERITVNNEEIENGSWLIVNFFEQTKRLWEEMTIKDQYSTTTKECIKKIKPIVLKYKNSKRNKLFFLSFSLYKLYKFLDKKKAVYANVAKAN